MDLDWELGVFRALRALWRAVAPTAPQRFDPGRAAQLATLEPRLRVVAAVIARRPLRILAGRSAGGVRGDDLLLPPFIELGPSPEVNAGLYVLRTALDASIARRSLAVPASPGARFLAGLSAGVAAQQALRASFPAAAAALADACALVLASRPADLTGRAAQEDALIRAALSGRDPGLDPALAAQLDALPRRGTDCPPPLLWGRLIPSAPAGATEGSPEDEDEPLTTPDADGTEHAAPPVEEVHRVTRDPERVKELPVHVFEKVETLEAFAGTMRQLDGSDELDEHLEALQEVDLSHLFRGGPQAKSLYRTDLMLDGNIPDVSRLSPGDNALPYDEWDARKRTYRRDWCQVYPSPLPGDDGRWAAEATRRHRRLIDRLSRQLRLSRLSLRPARRQLDGHSIDVDAVVRSQATVAAGRSPSRRLYIRQRRPQPERAVTVLLDLSLSADSWVGGRRVLDVSREAALVLGEVTERMQEPLQILAFASHTRNQIRVWGIRDWGEPWSAARRRLGTLRPQGYTRIGPAIRHATAELLRAPGQERLLLLLSDGKPTDYDRYEGRYGIADVRQAVREARSARVRVHALAVDTSARDHLPAMMGVGGWSILSHPDQLITVLAEVYARQ